MNYNIRIISIFAAAYCLLLSTVELKAQEPEPAVSEEKPGMVDLGYMSLPYDAVTGAISTVYGSELRKSPDASLARTFVGRFSGLTTKETDAELTVGGYGTESIGMSWWVRGISTVNGTAPMIILDGVYCPNTNYVYITPEEIESVTLLKDAAVLSLYGIQGANGAISIRTKRGYDSTPRVTVNYDQSFQQMTNTPHFLNSGEYVRMRNQAGYNDGLGMYSQYSQADVEKFTAGGSELYPDNNWYGMFVRPVAFMSRAGVSVRGGNGKLSYYTNVNYLHQTSVFRTVKEEGSKYDPQPNSNWFNFRSNVDVKFNKYLGGFIRLAGNIKNDKTTGYGNSDIYSHIFTLPPTMYGPLTPSGEDYENGGQVVTHEDENYPVYGMLNRSGYIKNLSINITAQAGLDVDFGFLTKGLKLSGLMAYQTSTFNQTTIVRDFERYIRTKDMNGLYFVKLGSTNNTPLSYGKVSTMDYNLNLSGNLSYNRTFGDHSVNAMAYIFYSSQDLQKSPLPYKRASMGVTATYGYGNRYFVKADVGYSGSEQFHPDRRYVATPAISAAWVATNEPFMADVDWLSYLKLRASYGITANDQLGSTRFLYLDYLDIYGNEGLKGNPYLTAEKMKKQNYGLELELFRQFRLSFDWYRSDCDNMLIGSAGTIPEYQGVALGNYPLINNGKMTNQGFEIAASYEKDINADWSVRAGGSFSYNRNKVIDVREAPYAEDYAYRKRTEGYPVGQIWGYKVDYSNGNGMFNFQEELDASGLTYSFGTPRVGDLIYQDLNGDKTIDEKDLAPIGNPTVPRQSYNLSLGFRFRGLEVSLLFQGVGEVSTVVGGTGVYENSYLGVYTDIHEHAWTQERWNNGERIDYPALSLNRSTNHQVSDFFVWNASYFRLKNAEIAYTLPRRISQKIKAENIRFSLSGQNLLTFGRMRSKYIDPEIGGYDRFQPFRVVNVGINLIF